MTEKSHVKDLGFMFTDAPVHMEAFFKFSL